MDARAEHIPVLYQEVLAALAPRAGGRYIDCTLGGGGHALGILERSSPDGRLLGIDADPEALKIATARLEPYRSRCILINDNYINVGRLARERNFVQVDGVLFDLGFSTIQIESLNRGFSFRVDAPLDMRFDPRQEITAEDLISTSTEQELAEMIFKYGEERRARAVARAIVAERARRPIETTGQMTRIIERVVPKQGKIHPATRTFQALRIAVNRELENLESALGQVVELLAPGGKLAVISFHSLEDRLVKQFFAAEARGCICPPRIPVCVCGHKARLEIATKKAIAPSSEEVQRNPRSRSAKLRVARRVGVRPSP
ncbi:MAG: 16S rRNA (cytosine(1402)-N(4))-methyltransferase RsmH [Chloroflexi bacterium]|nr:16S rRNA (cytosine(1402)-N(4))-methyltransferase RsmH [Chloroflexota bacterium]